MTVRKNEVKRAVSIPSETGMTIVGAVSKNSSHYSTHFERRFNVDGSPKDYELEAIFNAPQDYISKIVGYSKYCYRKHGIIMRVINIMRDFGSDGVTLSYPRKDKNVKQIVNDYNKRIHIDQLIHDMIFELALTGNLALYDRDGERVDIYPVDQIEVLPLVKDNKQVIAYKNPVFSQNISNSYDPEIDKLIENAYPDEIIEARKNGKQYAILNPDYAYFAKINSSQYERYGISVILPAFEDLAHKSLLKEAEKATANDIIDKVFLTQVGDENNQPTKKLIDEYSDLLDGMNGSLRVTVPYYVNMKWVEPNTSFFGRDKYIQIDTDILNTLGVSLNLIRGEGSQNYAGGTISFVALIQTINNIRAQIPDILTSLYAKELARHGLPESAAPTITFKDVVIDKEAKLNLVKDLFSTAGLPYKVLFEECGYDFDYIRLIREEENKQDMGDTFELHSMPFQGNQSFSGDNEGGAPEKSATSRKSDKNQSNNNTPRPGISGRSE